MAVRGVLSTLFFYNTEVTGSPSDFMQNYFASGYSYLGDFYAYNSFQGTPITKSRDQVTGSFTITFAATASNVDFVENAISNMRFVVYTIYRWSDNEGLENPTTLNILALGGGHCMSATSDFSTISLNASTYNKTVNADFPGRKVPWEILGPLSSRR